MGAFSNAPERRAGIDCCASRYSRTLLFLRLGSAVLRKHVSALQALHRRHQGEPVETPRISEPTHDEVPTGRTLRAALEGWKKIKARNASTLREFEYAVRLFVELHGDLPVTDGLGHFAVRETVRGWLLDLEGRSEHGTPPSSSFLDID
jgi:hypothetical protein